MNKVLRILIPTIAAIFCVRQIKDMVAEKAAFDRHEALVAEANACLESGEWNGAEKNIRLLLRETPDDKNLQLHLAGILFEQERYEECIGFVDSLGHADGEFDFLRKKSKALLQEMETLQLEKSTHFRLEFEGKPARSDIMEALSVLEVAYDSLCRLFEFYPENKMHLVLYQSAEYQGIGPRPDWVGAVYDGKLRVPVSVMRYREIYRPMLFHELTHAFVRAMTRAKVPLWINEGIAQVIDGSRRDLPRPQGPVPSITALTDPFVNENRTAEAVKLYWYSERMVQALLRRNGDFVHFRTFVQNLYKLGAEQSLLQFYSVTAKQLLEEVRLDEVR